MTANVDMVDCAKETSAPGVQTEPIANRLSNRDSLLKRLLAVGDATAVCVALSLALLLVGRPAIGSRLVWGLAALPLMILLFKLYGLYDRDTKRISHTTVDDLPWIFHAVVTGSLLLWLYSKGSPMGRLDLGEILTFGLGVVFLSTAARFIVRTCLGGLLGTETALLIGSGRMADVLVAKLANHPEYGCAVVGVLSDVQESQTSQQLPVLGTPRDLAEVAARSGASRVFVTGAELAELELEKLLRRCRSLALKVSVLPQLSDVLGPGVEISDVEGVMVLGVNSPWLPRSSRALKRMLDLTVAGTLLLLLSPVLLLLALLIKLDSRGPVLFSQERIGRRGKPFRVLKFRSMVVDAEAMRAALLSQSKDPNWLHLERDPRITRIGRFLRLSSLDELPQLWNVIRGQMSLVGPRPLIGAEDRMVLGWARGRLDLTPGITGYWQVLGRTRIPFEEMVKLDYLYVMTWSLWNDIRLILRTLPTVLGRRGAN